MKIATTRLGRFLQKVARKEWWRRPILAALCLAFSYLAAQRVLPTDPAPQEIPPKVVALPPAEGLHSGRNGYVIGLTLDVKDCSDPVSGFFTVALPKEYFEAEKAFPLSPPPRRALFGAAFNDPNVNVTFVGPDHLKWARDARFRSWVRGFADPEHVDATGTAAVARFDGWRKHPDQLTVEFSADWLHPRGYGSCWLATPELVGDLETLAINASGKIDHAVGGESGAEHLSTGGSSGSVIVRRYRNGAVEKHRFREPFSWDYVSSSTPASLGFVSLETPMNVLSSESIGPAPGVGHPTWSCSDTHSSTASQIHLYGLGQDGAFRWGTDVSVREYEGTEDPTRCGSWIALQEPGSQSGHDLWLLLIGATLSAGIALLVDASLGGRRRRG